MKTIIGILLFMHLMSFYVLNFFPNLYPTLLASLTISTFFVCLQIIKEIMINKDRKQFFVFAGLLGSVFLIISYIAEIRWSINPFGMIDAYAMWVGKGRVLAISILEGDPLPLWNTYWRMPNYPLGIPLLHANFSLAFPTLENFLTTIRIPNYIYLALLYSFILGRIQELKSIRFKILFIITTGAFLFQPNYLLVTSDLCADFPVSVVLAIVTFFLLNSEGKYDFYWMISCLALLINLKSEALLIAMLASIFFLYLYLSKKQKLIRPFLILFLLLIFFGSPTWYLFGKGSFLSSDFKDVNNSPSQLQFLIGRLFDKQIWLLIIKYFSNFYFTLTKGLTLSLILIVLIWGNRKLRIGGLFYLVCISTYTGIFLLTSLDPEIHLDQAYDRIHLQLFLIPLVIFWEFIKQNENLMTKLIRELGNLGLNYVKILKNKFSLKKYFNY